MMRLLLFGLKFAILWNQSRTLLQYPCTSSPSFWWKQFLIKKIQLRLKPDVRALVPDPKFNREHNEHMRRNMCPSVDHEMTTWSQLWQKKMTLVRVNWEGCYDMATCWTMSTEPNMRCPHGNLIAMPTVDQPLTSQSSHTGDLGCNW